MPTLFKISIAISVILFIAAVICLYTFGLSLGVDFSGGTVVELAFTNGAPSTQELTEFLESIDGVTEASAAPTESSRMLIRLNPVSEAVHQDVIQKIQERFGAVEEVRFDFIGPSVGEKLRSQSMKALIVALGLIVLYMGIVFRGMRRVLSPYILGISGVVAVLHDVLITAGVFAVLGHYYGITIGAVYVAAVLTIIGYSISDTVVVFDRLRENVIRFGNMPFHVLIVKSIRETLVRSINTSLTTIVSLLAVFFFGGESVKYFALSLIIGIAFGTYSSILVASPIVLWWHQRYARKRR